MIQELYSRYHRLLFSLAYQLTGSVSDAEDVVQDVYLKSHDVEMDSLIEPKAYLCKMVTNRCRDLFKSARMRREQYFGQWLPEPLPTRDDETVASMVQGESLSYAMLVLLERLSITERSVFVLREAFGFEYAEIAALVDKSESNCRKLMSRARGKTGINPDEPVNSDTASEEWVRRFLEALKQENVSMVVSMLGNDVVLISDGGGKASAAVYPIESRDHVARFLLGLMRKGAHNEGDMRIELREINAQPGIVVRVGEDIITVALIHVEISLIRNVYFVRNPDKLKHL